MDSLNEKQIITLLLSAGYYRCGIKGLDVFDKIVGGMIWCLQNCSVDLDVDFLFVEDSSIGVRIAMTEQIVEALLSMNAPSSLLLVEPHQIQGLDLPHLYPLIQWLIEKALENRREQEKGLRNYALYRFHSAFPESESKSFLSSYFCKVNTYYGPKRRSIQIPKEVNYSFEKREKDERRTERIQSTLLEFKSIGASCSTMILSNLTKNIKCRGKKIENLLQFHRKEFSQRDPTSKMTQDPQSRAHQKRKQETEIEEVKGQNEALQKHQIILELKLEKNQRRLYEYKDSESLRSSSSSHLAEKIEELLLKLEALKKEEESFKRSCRKSSEVHKKKNEEFTLRSEKINKEIDEKEKEIIMYKRNLGAESQRLHSLLTTLSTFPNSMEVGQYQRRFNELNAFIESLGFEKNQFELLQQTLETQVSIMKTQNEQLEFLLENGTSFPSLVSSLEKWKLQLDISSESMKSTLEESKRQKDSLTSRLLAAHEESTKYEQLLRHFQNAMKRNEILVSQSNLK